MQWVLPGHGAPFSDVKAALARARSRLAGFRADPSRHARHAARALLKFHLLEERQHALADLRDWFAATPVMERMWRRLGEPQGSPQGWCEALVTELVGSGVLALRDGVVHDA